MSKPRQKKDKSIHVRLTERAKEQVEEQAKINNRTVIQEVEALVYLGLHVRKFSIREFV